MMNPTYAITIDQNSIARHFAISMMDKLQDEVSDLDVEAIAMDMNTFNDDLQELVLGGDRRAWAKIKELFAQGYTCMMLESDVMNTLEELEAEDKNYVVIVKGSSGNTLGTLEKGQLSW